MYASMYVYLCRKVYVYVLFMHVAVYVCMHHTEGQTRTRRSENNVSSERAFELAHRRRGTSFQSTSSQPETLDCSRSSSRRSYSALHTPYLASKQTIVYHRLTVFCM